MCSSDPSSLLCLFSKLSSVARYFLYVLPVALFILSGPWFQIVMVLCGVTMAYEMMKFLVTTLTWYLYSALSSTLCFGNHISETISNYTCCLFSSGSQSVEGTGKRHFSLPVRSPFLLHHPLIPRASYGGSPRC